MSKGGVRNRGGRQPDPDSLESARLGRSFETLDQDGYDGPVPDCPLPPMVVRRWEFEDKRRFQVVDDEATEWFRDRELRLWEWAWHTPQATAWAREPWRIHSVSMWVRTATICEGSDATAADKNSLHRFADQIGLSPAGLKENGWVIGSLVVDEDDLGDEDDVRAGLTVVTGGAA